MNKKQTPNKDLKDNKNTELEARIVELENNWKRALADYKNLQNRVQTEKQDILIYANKVLISKLLFVLDNLTLMRDHLNDQGLNMIVKEFEQILKDEGLEEIEVINKDFDARYMDAVEMVEGEEGKVLETIQKGYLYKEKVLRPAKVKVGKSNNKN